MTLEVLFAAAGQRRTFLLMGLLGVALALLVHLGGSLHRVSRPLGMVADLLTAAGFVLAAAWIILGSGEGLRLYGLLGLCIGAALYLGGMAPAVEWAGKVSRKLRSKTRTGGTKE